MAPPDPDGTHRYRVVARWFGSTALGYEHYDREHVLAVPGVAELTASSDAAFRGDPTRLNPEQLLVAAASSCQLLSFLAVAARARVEVVAYTDDAEGIMPDDAAAPMSVTEIRLRPIIHVAGPVPEEKIRYLCEVAHRECFIANSLRSEISVHPTVHVVERPPPAEA